MHMRAHAFGALLYAYTPASVMIHPATEKEPTSFWKMSSETPIESTTFTLPST